MFRSKSSSKLFQRRKRSTLRGDKSLQFEQLEPRRLLAVLFADSFEQGEWNGQWVEDSQNDWSRSTQRANDGSYAAEVDGRATDATLTMANSIDLATYDSAELTFSWFIENNWDGGEYIAMDMYDGSSWNEAASLNGNGGQENQWVQETITIDGGYLVDDFNIRFRSNVSSNKEDGHVDNVQITGTPVEPVQVFFFVGQSNMAGWGNIDELTSPYDVPQSDVWIWQDDLAENVGWTPLRGGFGGDTNRNSGGDGIKFGPEVSFGRALADTQPNTHFALIKHTEVGATATMEDGWNPDRGGGAGPGQIWTNFITKTQNSLTALDNSQISYELAGLIVAQGGSDMVTESGAANYEQNFTQFINGVRQEFGEPDLPVVFGRVNNAYHTTVYHDGLFSVRAAQEAVAAADPLATMVQADDLPRLDGLHFDTDGQLTFGTRIASAFLGEPIEGSATVGTDGFETGDFGGGYQQWSTGPWTVAGDVSVTATNDPLFGSYNAQLQGSSAELTRTVDVTGLSNVRLRLISRMSSFEASDTAQVKVSGDGVNWTTLLEFVDGQDDDQNNAHDLLIPDLGDTIHVRFDAEMDGLDDYWYVDVVSLTGTTPEGPALPTLAIDDVSLVEGNNGTSVLNFTVTRSGDTSESSSVDFNTANGTASAPSDYVGVSGTVQFLAGESSQAIAVHVNGDIDFEADETFFVDLYNPTDATISDSQGQGTIANDDANSAPTISSSPATIATEDSLYDYDVDGSDPDIGDVLTFSLDVAPSGMSIDSSDGLIQWTPINDNVGANSVTVRVTDSGGLFDTQAFIISVANVNDTPTIISSPVTTGTEDELYIYDVDATDPDVGDSLTYFLDSAPTGMTFNSASGLIQWIPNNGQIGANPVAVRVQDAGGLSDVQSFTIVVEDATVTPAVVFSDSFENGQWNGLWVEDNQNDWFTSTQRSTDGNNSAEVDGRATDATLTVANPIDLSGYSSAELTFDWLIENGFDSGEYLALDFFNGSSWIEVLRLDGNVDPENTWHGETVQLDSQYLINDFRFRYRADVNKSNEDANVDNVKLTGSNGALHGDVMGTGSDVVELDLRQAISLAPWAEALWHSHENPTGLNYELRIADLPGNLLGLTGGNVITIDADAAGMGWFIDATPWENSEFVGFGSVTSNRYDLLTVLAHEFGHLLGHDHADHGVMSAALNPGERLLPGGSHGRSILAGHAFDRGMLNTSAFANTSHHRVEFSEVPVLETSSTVVPNLSNSAIGVQDHVQSKNELMDRWFAGVSITPDDLPDEHESSDSVFDDWDDQQLFGDCPDHYGQKTVE